MASWHTLLLTPLTNGLFPATFSGLYLALELGPRRSLLIWTGSWKENHCVVVVLDCWLELVQVLYVKRLQKAMTTTDITITFLIQGRTLGGTKKEKLFQN